MPAEDDEDVVIEPLLGFIKSPDHEKMWQEDDLGVKMDVDKDLKRKRIPQSTEEESSDNTTQRVSKTKNIINGIGKKQKKKRVVASELAIDVTTGEGSINRPKSPGDSATDT